MENQRTSPFLYLLFVGAAFGIVAPNFAHAARVARFDTSAQNFLTTGLVRSDVDSNCSITIVNTSEAKQTVTATIRLYANVVNPPPSYGWTSHTSGVCPTPPGGAAHSYSGAAGTNLVRTITITFDMGRYSDGAAADCTGSSNSCTLPLVSSGHNMSFPLLCTNARTVQNVRCEGEIVVNNHSTEPTVAGHVTASGTITTTVESVGGVGLGTTIGTSGTNTAAPTFTPIIIGEGRPF